MKKFIRNWVTPLVIAICIAVPLNTFVVSVVQVKADVLTEYTINNRIVINKFDKDIKTGDIIEFKKDNENLIRKVISVNNDVIIVSDKSSNTMNINKSDIVGKAICKIF